MRDFLKSFFEVTKFTEGRQSTINRVLPVLDFLMHKFENETRLYETDSFMALSLNAGFLKLQKYWKLSVDRATVYIAAVVLDPSQKWDYFSHWDIFQLDQAKESLQKLWSKYNHSRNADTALQSPTPEDILEVPEFRRWMIRAAPATAPVDELEQYLLEPRINDPGNILSWWKDQRDRFPMLARMAINVHSIPSMSSEPERVFSGAKHTISDERASLKPNTIEALECSKSMLRAGIFTDTEISAAIARELEEIQD